MVDHNEQAACQNACCLVWTKTLKWAKLCLIIYYTVKLWQNAQVWMQPYAGLLILYLVFIQQLL